MDERTDQALRAQFAVDTREIWTAVAQAAADRILWPILFRMFWAEVTICGLLRANGRVTTALLAREEDVWWRFRMFWLDMALSTERERIGLFAGAWV